MLATVQGHLQRRLETGDKDPLVLMLPAGDPVRSFFDALGTPHITGVLGMAKLLDPAALLAAIQPLLPPGVEFDAEPDGLTVFRAPGGELALEEPELLPTLVEPQGARARVTRLEEALGQPLTSLPVRPFVWGLDSI